MKTFEIRNQSSDVKIYALADTYEELFSVALEGLCELLLPDNKLLDLEFDYSKSIVIESVDISTLLVDFLSYALSMMQKNKALFPKLEIKELSNDYLKGNIHGYPQENFNPMIKSISYHSTEIFPTKDNKFEVTIVPEIQNI